MLRVIILDGLKLYWKCGEQELILRWLDLNLNKDTICGLAQIGILHVAKKKSASPTFHLNPHAT